MCSNGDVGCGVGSGICGGGDSGGVYDIVAKGPQRILKQHYTLEWLNCSMSSGNGVGGGSSVSDGFVDV